VKICFETVLLQFVCRGAEGVGLDDVGASFDVFGVNLPNEVWITEIQFVVTAIDVNTFGVKHRSHRAVDDVNAISFQEVFKGLHKITEFDVRALACRRLP